jgi:hypothetical protein
VKSMFNGILTAILRRHHFGRRLLEIRTAPGMRLLPKGTLAMKDHGRLKQAPAPLSSDYAMAGADIAAKLAGAAVGNLPPPSPFFLRRPRRWQQIVTARAHAASLRLLTGHSTHKTSAGG